MFLVQTRNRWRMITETIRNTPRARSSPVSGIWVDSHAFRPIAPWNGFQVHRCLSSSSPHASLRPAAIRRLAGQCFAHIQGGPYNGPHLAQLVDTIRSLGVRGVGQSSWGPTLFALLPEQAAAERFQRCLSEKLSPPLLQIIISPPNRRGARITVQSI